MIVTIVADVFGKANNGTTIAAIHLIDALRNAGHTVRVVCPDKDKKGKENFYIVRTFWAGPLQPIVDKNGVSLDGEQVRMSGKNGTGFVNVTDDSIEIFCDNTTMMLSRSGLNMQNSTGNSSINLLSNTITIRINGVQHALSWRTINGVTVLAGV